jgi:hypothetical protein
VSSLPVGDNILVTVRVRPAPRDDSQVEDVKCVSVSNGKVISLGGEGQGNRYAFDR